MKAGLTADGTIIVADVVRGRFEWPAAVRTIGETATLDGIEVSQGVETVGAQVGALQTLLADPSLLGLVFSPVQAHADKTTRALPVVALAEQGKLAVVRGAWNQDFIDDLCAVPESKHDDQVDSLSAACSMFATSTGGAFTEASIRASSVGGRKKGQLMRLSYRLKLALLAIARRDGPRPLE